MASRINFTLAALAKIIAPADSDRLYVYDKKKPGLCLCVTRNDARSFYLYRKVHSRPERIRIGDARILTIEQARDAVDRLNGDIADGANPAEEKRRARGEMTLADVFVRYIDEYAKVHKKSWQDDQDQFDRYAGGIKSRRLSAIARRDIQTLHTKIGSDNGQYAANRLLALLSKVFAFAVDLGYERGNPCRGVKRFREISRERFVQTDELPRLLKSFDDHEDQNVADFFRLCLFTGARRSNVQAMAWSDVHFGRRQWAVKGAFTKNGEPLTLDLTDEAMTILQSRWKARQSEAVYVFPSYGKAGHLTEPKAAWAAILKRAEITDLRIHDLRRTLGSYLAMAGVSLPIIGKALGHKSQQSTAVYARLARSPVTAAMQAATSTMASLAIVPKPKPKRKRKSA